MTSARERTAAALSRNSSPLKLFDLNRSTSPSPARKSRENISNINELNSRSTEKRKELFRETSPLKSTNFLKTVRASSKSDLFNDLENEEKKHPFTTEKTFFINNSNNNNNSSKSTKERRLSIEILNTCHRVNERNRASPESDSSRTSTSSLSSFSSPLSSSSESFCSNTSDKISNDKLSQRRISLEQRLNARTRVNSPERHIRVTRKISETKTSPNGTTTTSTTSSSSFIYRKSSTCANLFSSNNTISENNSSDLKTDDCVPPPVNKPVPASRKISLQVPQRKPLPTPRRKSLSNLIAPQDRSEHYQLLE